MTVQPSALSAEIAKRGDAIYEAKIRYQFEKSHGGKVAAIDVNTEAFVIEDTALEAADKLRAQQPDAQIWLIRLGSRYLRRMRRNSSTR
jgi:hypothetical protein